MFLDVRRRCPKVEFAFGPLSLGQLRTTLVDGLPILAGELAGALYLQGYPLIINRLLGPATVVTFTTIRTASRVLFQGVQMVSMASGSELSRTYGSKDWEAYLRLLKVVLAVTLWAAVGVCFGFTIFGPWAIAHWTSGKVIAGHGVLFLFALSVAFQSGWSACGALLVSTNMHHSFNYVYLGLTCVGLCAVTFFEHRFGFSGVPLTTIIVDGLLLGWALHICRRKLTFIRLASLAVVFKPMFYTAKADVLWRRFLPPNQDGKFFVL